MAASTPFAKANRSTRFVTVVRKPLYSSSVYGSMAAPDQPWLRISMAFSWALWRTTSQAGLLKKSDVGIGETASGIQ